jgi:hypothetical protein
MFAIIMMDRDLTTTYMLREDPSTFASPGKCGTCLGKFSSLARFAATDKSYIYIRGFVILHCFNLNAIDDFSTQKITLSFTYLVSHVFR